MINPQTPLKKPEFLALMGMMFATVAFSIDSMLPALPTIAAELTPTDLNRAQLVLTSFVIGMGLGTFVTGPLSDTFGRRRVLLAGFALYMIGAVLATIAGSLEMLLAARVLQGLGASGPRVVTTAIIRDLYSGRQMAQMMSFVFMVFAVVPAIAPSMGAVIIYYFDWRGVFAASIVFALFFGGWFYLRQPETLPPQNRRPFNVATLKSGVIEVLSNRTVRVTISAQFLVLGVLFGMLSSVQQIFDITFDQGANFPLWFGAVAVVSTSASVLNATLVLRVGMRMLIRMTLAVQIVLSGIMAFVIGFDLMPDALYFPAFLIWMTSVFFMAGMVLGNLNAIAMEPMGHIAGMAASVTSSISTVLAAVIAIPIGLAFDGTPLPLSIAAFFCIVLALLVMQLIRTEPV